MNAYASHVVSYLLAQSWQIAILAAVVGLISFALRNRSAHLRYLLWLIVLAKCLVPPFLTIPLAVLPEQFAGPFVGGFSLPDEYPAPATPVSVGGGEEPQESKRALPGTPPLIAAGWIGGVFLFLLWVGGRAVRYASWLRDQRRPLPPALQESIQELSLGFNFRKWPRIWLMEDISQPFVWGLLRGDIYLPTHFVGLAGSDQQRSVLAHELSHVARFDAGVNLLQVLVQAVYWFHPLIWWANRRIRQEREKCCDEMAVAHLNTPPEHYTGAIIDALAAERRSAHPIPSLAIVGSVRDIEERIKTMLKPGKTFRRRPSLVAATLTLLIALATIPTALVLTARGQTPPPAESVNKPGANTEKPEQPRFAARTFNAKTAFDVIVVGMEAAFDPKVIGSTPSASPLAIPACRLWWVQPSGPVEDWDLLAREIDENKVPCLKLDLTTNADGRITRPGPASDSATDADMKHLAGLTGLQWLDLSHTQVGDAGLAELKGLRALESLKLVDTQVTDAGLEHLKGLTGLRDLILHSQKITDTGLGHLKDLTGLQSLAVTGAQVTDSGLAHVKNLTGLQALYLTGLKITDAGLEHLRGMTGLQRLSLMNTQITDAGLGHLEGLTRLQSLVLAGPKITDAGMVHLKGLARLEVLDLHNVKITDAGLVPLEGLVRLQTLNLQDTAVTDAGLVHLRGLTRLQWLCLIRTRIDGTGLAYLKDLTELTFLNIADTQVTDAALEHLKGLTQLRTLSLNAGITDAGLQHLEGLTGLEYLCLQKPQQVTEAALAQLKQSLPKLTVARW